MPVRFLVLLALMVVSSCFDRDDGAASRDGQSAMLEDWTICASYFADDQEELVSAARVQGRYWLLSRKPMGGGQLSMIETMGRDTMETRRVAVGLRPVDLVVDGQALWVVNALGAGTTYPASDEGPGYPDENSVMRVNAQSGTVEATIEVDQPVRLFVEGGEPWVLSFGADKALIPLLSAGETESIPVEGAVPIDLASTGDAMWVLTQISSEDPGGQSSRVQRIDLGTRQVEDVVPGDQIGSLMTTTGMVWGLVKGSQGRVIGMWPTDDPPPDITRLSFPQAAIVSSGRMWVADDLPALHGYGLETGRKLAEVRLPVPVHSLASDPDGLLALAGDRVLSVCRGD